METKTTEELLERRTAIASEVNTEGADLDALETEARAINAELERRQVEERKRQEVRDAVANGDGETIKTFEERKESKTMTFEEIRSSKEYMNAWAEGIKTGHYDECRKLFTENAENIAATDGAVPVPTYVEGRINAMFENNELLKRVRRTYFNGNLKVGFEVSSTGAVDHAEGGNAIADEQLVIGTVEIIAAMLKKTILISDELLDMHGEEFLDYVFDEFENKIEDLLCQHIIEAIDNAPAASTTSAVGVPAISASAVALDLVARALANITEGSNHCILMNRATFAAFRAAQMAAGYAVDPFEGLPIVYTKHLPAVADAKSGDAWLIVGDLNAVTANFPNGDNVKFIYDPYTNAPADLVRLTGRLYAGVGLTGVGMLAKVEA